MDGLNLQIDLNQNAVRYPPQAMRQGKGLTLMRPHQASTYDVSYHYGEILMLSFHIHFIILTLLHHNA